MRLGILYMGITAAAAVLVVNLVSVCVWATQLPTNPGHAVWWATARWLLVLIGIWSIGLFQFSLRYRRAQRAGPPRVWAWQGTDSMTRLEVVGCGIDPLGSPAWRVDGVVLPNGINVMVEGLTRHAALYALVDDVLVRLEEGRGVGVVVAR